MSRALSIKADSAPAAPILCLYHLADQFGDLCHKVAPFNIRLQRYLYDLWDDDLPEKPTYYPAKELLRDFEKAIELMDEHTEEDDLDEETELLFDDLEALVAVLRYLSEEARRICLVIA